MRKATLAIVFCVLLLFLSVVPLLQARAQPIHTPHENPDRAEEIFKPYILLGNYSIFLEFAANARWDDADSMADLLATIEVPAAIQSAIDAYTASAQEVTESFSQINKALKKADELITDGYLAEAEVVLTGVDEDLDRAEDQINDMFIAVENLAEQMGSFVTDMPLFNDALDLHKYILGLLQDSRDYYLELYGQLNADAGSSGLRTKLTLKLSSGTVYVGEQITLEGKLRYYIDDSDIDGTALPGRELLLRLGSPASVIKVVTGAGGEYSGTLDMPYQYMPSTKAKASFAPVTVFDKANYRSGYAESEVSIGFFETGLELTDVPTKLLSGYAFTVSGIVSGDEAQLSGRDIQMYIDEQMLATGVTATGGSFELDGVTPANLPLGHYHLKVEVTEDNDSQSSGSDESVSVNISQDVPKLIFNAPSFVFASSSARFSGRVSYNDEPVPDAVVTVTFDGQEYPASTGNGGNFDVDIELPQLAVTSSKTVLVHIDPVEDWLSPVEMEHNLFVLSYLNIGFFSLAAIASGVIVFRLKKKRSRLSSKRREKPSDSAYVVSQSELWVKREGVLAAYDRASAVMQQLTGVKAGSNMTLRDYVNELDPKLGRMKKIFTDITSLAETALYAANPGSGDVEEANRLLIESPVQ